MKQLHKSSGFTIVELLVVVVVIAILAAITIVSYNGVAQRAVIATMKNDLGSARTQLEMSRTTSGSNEYPSSTETAALKASGDNVLQYTYISSPEQGYCVSVVNSRVPSESFHIQSSSGSIESGLCDGHVAADQGPNTWSAVATGTQHKCAIYSARAYCWGINWDGGLGTANGSDASAPTAVSTAGVLNGKNITAIAVSIDSYNTSCAIADGSAYCWGATTGYGLLGNGSATGTSNVPVAVATNTGLSGKTVTKLSMGSQHACVVASGQAYCWGMTPGNGSASTASSPTLIGGLLSGKTVTDISAGMSHSCAIADAQAYCWGNNTSGKLGNGNTIASTSPVAVDTSSVLAGKAISSISAGDVSSCAVAEGKAYCWGRGDGLGINSYSDSYMPVAVLTSGDLSGKTVSKVVAGDRSGCALAEGKMYCWGSVTGFTPLSPHSFVPSGASSGDAITAMSLDASDKYCAVANNSVRCN